MIPQRRRSRTGTLIEAMHWPEGTDTWKDIAMWLHRLDDRHEPLLELPPTPVPANTDRRPHLTFHPLPGHPGRMRLPETWWLIRIPGDGPEPGIDGWTMAPTGTVDDIWPTIEPPDTTPESNREATAPDPVTPDATGKEAAADAHRVQPQPDELRAALGEMTDKNSRLVNRVRHLTASRQRWVRKAREHGYSGPGPDDPEGFDFDPLAASPASEAPPAKVVCLKCGVTRGDDGGTACGLVGIYTGDLHQWVNEAPSAAPDTGQDTGHVLHLKGDPIYGWELQCTHAPGGNWQTTDEAGEWESDDCWVMSWWENTSPEDMIDWDRGGWALENPTLPIPVDVGGGDGWDIPPTIVPARPSSGTTAGQDER